jgi:hypothetical protein
VLDGTLARSIRTNGKPDASLSHDPAKPAPDEYTMSLTGLLPLVHKPDARHAAVIGFGSGMTTATLLGSPRLERLDTIEIEPQMVKGARMFGDRVEPAFTDPRSRIVIDDAKSYFARGSLRYDLIVSEPSNPWVSGVASLFTREFYARVKQQLAPGGLFVQWLQIYEFNDALMGTVFRALDAEFGDYVVYAANEGDMIIVAAPERVPAPSSEALERWPGMKRVTGRLHLDRMQEIESRRLAGRDTIRTLLPALGSGENSDYFPVVDQQAPEARFLRSNADLLMRLSTVNVPVVDMLERREGSTVPVHPDATAALGARRSNTAIAQDLADWLISGSVPGGREPVLPRDAGLLRAVLWECATLPPRTRVSALLMDVADYVNGQLPPAQATRVWSAVRSARCASRLDAAEVRWLDLFAATGARSAADMARLGAELVTDAGVSMRLRTYALVAATTGLLVQGRHAEARQFLERHLPQLPAELRREPALMLLAQRAFENPGVRGPAR